MIAKKEAPAATHNSAGTKYTAMFKPVSMPSIHAPAEKCKSGKTDSLNVPHRGRHHSRESTYVICDRTRHQGKGRGMSKPNHDPGTGAPQSDRANFTIVPNLIFTMGLSPQAGYLLCFVRSVTGDEGVCYYSTRQLAEILQMSVGAVSAAKRELVATGLIAIDQHSRWQRDQVRVCDIWAANAEHAGEAPPAPPRVYASAPVELGAATTPDPEEAAQIDPPPPAPVHNMNTTPQTPPASVHNMNTTVHIMNVKEDLINKKGAIPGDDPLLDLSVAQEPNAEQRGAALWAVVAHELRVSMAEVSQRFLERCRRARLEGGLLVIEVDDARALDWLNSRVRYAAGRAASVIGKRKIEVSFEVSFDQKE